MKQLRYWLNRYPIIEKMVLYLIVALIIAFLVLNPFSRALLGAIQYEFASYKGAKQSCIEEYKNTPIKDVPARCYKYFEQDTYYRGR